VRRIAVIAALIGLAACGDPSAVRGNSSGQQPIATSVTATTLAQTTTAAAPTSTTTTTTTTTTTSTSTTSTSTTSTVLPSTTTAVAVSPASAAPANGELLALDVLSLITVSNEHRGGYVRDVFGYPADLDRDGCDTRSEVLQSESISPAQVDPYGCTVVAGDWSSVYDGLTATSPGELEIDHVVSLKEAWDSGAWAWNGSTLVAYGNDLTDPRALRAVTTATNRDKSDKDPSNWLPPYEADVCPFIGDWVAIKARWGMSMDQSEYGRIRNLLTGPCEGWLIAPLEPLPAPTTPSEPSPPPPPIPLVSPVPSTDPPVTEVYYANCTAARAAGAAPLHVGEPGYRTALDRDKDGVACE
jgi:Excalibur calcium-binding domain